MIFYTDFHTIEKEFEDNITIESNYHYRNRNIWLSYKWKKYKIRKKEILCNQDILTNYHNIEEIMTSRQFNYINKVYIFSAYLFLLSA